MRFHFLSNHALRKILGVATGFADFWRELYKMPIQDQEKRKNAQLLGGAMHQFHDTELQQSETVAELINNEPASVGKQEASVSVTRTSHELRS